MIKLVKEKETDVKGKDGYFQVRTDRPFRDMLADVMADIQEENITAAIYYSVLVAWSFGRVGEDIRGKKAHADDMPELLLSYLEKGLRTFYKAKLPLISDIIEFIPKKSPGL